MRRIFAVMLAVCLCLSLVACGKSKKAESVPAPTSVPEATSVPEPASEPADAPPQETAPNIAAADVAAAPTDGEKTLAGESHRRTGADTTGGASMDAGKPRDASAA